MKFYLKEVMDNSSSSSSSYYYYYYYHYHYYYYHLLYINELFLNNINILYNEL